MGLRRTLLGFTACFFLVLGLTLIDQDQIVSGLLIFCASAINLVTYGFFKKDKTKLFIAISLFNAVASAVVSLIYFTQEHVFHGITWLVISFLFLAVAFTQFMKMRKP